MSDLLGLLKEVRSELDGWRNKDHALCLHVDAAIAELESAPKRRCGTCRHYATHEQWCNNQDSPCFIFSGELRPEWFCADWQAKGKP